MPLSFTDLAVDLSEADDYVTARGYAGWVGSNEVKTAALRRGQDYIAGEYNDRWCEDFDNDNVPDLVKYAIIEAARRELTTPGFMAPDYVAASQIKRLNKEVGALKKETEYFGGGSAADVAPVVKGIDRLLSSLVSCSSIGVMVV